MGINEGLRKKDHILVNRGMIKKTFDEKGLGYVSELILKNLEDTHKLFDYNIKNNFKVYRMSSDSFPWMSHYDFESLKDYNKILISLKELGSKVIKNDLRVSFHPGPFNILGSEREDVVLKTIDELDKHSLIMDMMGLPQTTHYPINIHLNVTTPSHKEAAKRFCDNFIRLKPSTKNRLTIENDDKPSQYSVKMLYELVYKQIGIPIVVDSLHYKCHPDDMSWVDTLSLGISTWDTKPLCHHSSSKKLNEDEKVILSAHADFLYEEFDSCGFDVDVELECKQKDLALVKYLNDYRIYN
jgi:UV DNA damage endonuclease